MIKFLSKVKQLSVKIYTIIKSIWSKADKLADLYCPTAINIVNTIKSINDSVTTDVIASIVKLAIPSNVDDKIIDSIRSVLKEELPKISNILGIVDEVSKIEGEDKQLLFILNKLNNTGDNSKLYNDLAAKILAALSDGKLTFKECWGIVEYYYEESK